MCGIILAATITRILYFTQLNASSLVYMQRWNQSDMNYYDAWARTIAAGDWLSRSVKPPMHQWQRQVADEYLHRHPELVQTLAGEAQAARSPDVETLLWTRWMGTPRFYQDPLYAYFVAAVYHLVAADPRTVIALQLAVGIITIVLIWLVALQCFGDQVAACAALIAVLCSPLLFYEGLLLRESLVVLAGVAIVALGAHGLSAAPANSARRIWWAIVLGLACGLAWLLKSTFVVVPLVIAALVLMRYRPFTKAMTVCAAIAAGFAIAALPLAARNSAVNVAPLTLAALGPITFAASNSVDANPDIGWETNPAQLATFLGQTDGSLVSAVRTTVTAHTIRSYRRLLWEKFDRAWHWFEIPNNEDLYYAERRVPILRWLPISFWALSPLALVGLALGLRQFRAAEPLYLLVAFTLLSLVSFLVVGRQRVPLIGALIPFAALTIVTIVRETAERRYRVSMIVLSAVVVLGLWTGRPLHADQYTIRTADWLLPFSMRYQEEAAAAIDRQDWAHAAAAYREFFTRDAPIAAQVARADDPTLAPTLADMHIACADLLTRAGVDPSAELIDADTLLETDTAAEAVDARRHLTAALNRQAVALADAGRMNDAIDDFQRVVRLDPQNSHAHYNLGRALAARGSLTDALSEVQEATVLSPGDTVPRALAGELERALKGR